MDNPYFNILAHPTGRLINERKPYEVDMEQLMEAALGRGCFLELNAHHDRLDLSDTYCTMAKDMRLKLAISTDAHSTTDLDLTAEIADAMRMGKNINFFTDDPLGIGGLLSDTCTLTQLIISSNLPLDEMLLELLYNSKAGLDSFVPTDTLQNPSEHRLAFRELGLSIGLRAIEKIQMLIKEHPENFANSKLLDSQLASFLKYLDISEAIEKFWLEPKNQKSSTWREHLDINSVMLATSLAPEGYLMLR